MLSLPTMILLMEVVTCKPILSTATHITAQVRCFSDEQGDGRCLVEVPDLGFLRVSSLLESIHHRDESLPYAKCSHLHRGKSAA